MSDHVFAMSNTVDAKVGIMAAIGRFDDTTVRSIEITKEEIPFVDLKVVEATIVPDLPDDHGSGVLHVAMDDQAREWIADAEAKANPSPMAKIYKAVEEQIESSKSPNT